MARKKKEAPAEPEYVTIFADILKETEDAILVNCEGEELWLPKSEAEFAGDEGDEAVEITIPEWLADERGLSDGQGYIPPVGNPVAKAPESGPEPEAGDTPEDAAPAIVPAFTFKADVVTVNDEELELVVREPDEGNAQNFVITRALVSFEGDDKVNLEPGYEGIPFTMQWADAEAAGILRFLNIEAPEVAPQDALAEKPQAAPYRQDQGLERITVTHKYTDAEKAECADKMAALDGEIDALQSEIDGIKKDFKRRIEAKEDERKEIAFNVRKGEEEREIYCNKIADYDTAEMVWVSADDNTEVFRRPMTEKERQLPLPMEPFSPEHRQAEEELFASPPAAERETVTLYGWLLGDTENAFHFRVTYEDQSEAEFYIPFDQVTGHVFDNPDSQFDEITVYRAFAIEQGIIKDGTECNPEDAEPSERTCGTCAHIHASPEEGTEDPCADCQPEEFPNWTAQGGAVLKAPEISESHLQ